MSCSLIPINATVPTILWDNLGNQSGVVYTYSGTITAGFPPLNAFDSMSFDSFKVEAGGTETLDVTVPLGGDLDSIALFVRPTTAAQTIEFYYEDPVATFTTLLATFTVQEGHPQLKVFSSQAVVAGRKIRVQFVTPTEDLFIRQISFGPKMEIPYGQHNGISPVNLSQGVIFSNSNNENGEILGRSVKFEVRNAELMFDNLPPDFVRDDWEPFAVAVKTKSLFYGWDLNNYPLEVGFGGAAGINAPKNAAKGLMMVSMPLSLLWE